MNKGKLVRLAMYIECVVDADLHDEDAEQAVREMYWNGDACASPTLPELVSVTLVELDEDGCPKTEV